MRKASERCISRKRRLAVSAQSASSSRQESSGGSPSLGAVVEQLGEGARRPGPAVEHDRLVLEAAAAQGHPGREHGAELALGVPEVGQARALGHALERLVHLVRRREPAARVEDLGQHVGRERVGRPSLSAAETLLSERGRELARRGPRAREGLAAPRSKPCTFGSMVGIARAPSPDMTLDMRSVMSLNIVCWASANAWPALAPEARQGLHGLERGHRATSPSLRPPAAACRPAPRCRSRRRPRR